MNSELIPFQLAVRDAPAAPLADDTLACIHYGLEPPAASDPRILHVPLAVLDGPGRVEVWSGSRAVQIGHSDDIRHVDDGTVLFGSLHIARPDVPSVERTVVRAYAHIHGLLERLGFPHWLRMWNYLGSITEGEGDRERYRQFNVGRHRALSLRPDFERQLPAATAIGLRTEGLTICFLAGKRPAQQIENPRQVSAFHYPRDYGPKSPSFARATLQRWSDRSVLFLSGTASIVGHATSRAGDAVGQLEETLANIDSVLARANELHFNGDAGPGFKPHSYKVYVRSADVHAAVASRLRKALDSAAPLTVLEGDLCRRDLLLEIEALYERPHR